ncbi:cytochrome c oxidase assembly protein [Williamsia deligens]|uniref:Cytochrome c oxidase assembly protein n=1 Tax=Williamsia deligens TaxID=321325 RepID=A0ABW3GBL3_9NOCA|nr:cytochrome c oxidase assembly protein [Williamsia deligens]MCP2193123.1 Cytochrome c oxidase assembly factor CtaG [Williamsia deligens]
MPRPLTVETALTTGHLDLVTAAICVVVLVGYWWCWRRSQVSLGRGLVFSLLGVGVWALSTVSSVGAYADTLFWVRALQVVLLLLVAPFGLALGMPLTVLRDSLAAGGRDRFDRVLGSRAARMLTHPAVTSGTILVTPWLFYLTPWYTAVLRGDALDVLTRLFFVAVGLGYFVTRLQVDPVPRRRPQSLSLLITLAETIGDGLLGVVIWQGPDIAHTYYATLDRTWGPSLRTDQIIGAGILWVLGDVVGLPFLLALFGRFRAEQEVAATEVDAALDAEEVTAAAEPVSAGAEPATGGLWWEADPELRRRFGR